MSTNRKTYCCKEVVTLLLFTLATAVCVANVEPDSVVSKSDSTEIHLSYSPSFSLSDPYPMKSTAVRNMQYGNRARSSFWDYFGLGIEAAYHVNVVKNSGNLFKKDYYPNTTSIFDAFYWNNSMWLKLELSTPIFTISYQSDIPFYTSTHTNLHMMQADLNFWSLLYLPVSEDDKIKLILAGMILPAVTYEYMGTRNYVEQSWDALAGLGLLGYSFRSKRYFSTEGNQLQMEHRFYYLSFRKVMDYMSRYSAFFHKYCAAHGLDYEPLIRYNHWPFLILDMYGSLVIDKHFGKNGELLSQTRKFNKFSLDLGVMFVDDFVLDSANILIQPRIYWTFFSIGNGIRRTGLNLSIGLQYFM